MAKTLYYSVQNEHGSYLQGIEPTKEYNRTGTAPTMGNRHTPAEFMTVWGPALKTFEPLTLSSYIKVILEEYRWETRLPVSIAIHPTRAKRRIF